MSELSNKSHARGSRFWCWMIFWFALGSLIVILLTVAYARHRTVAQFNTVGSYFFEVFSRIRKSPLNEIELNSKGNSRSTEGSRAELYLPGNYRCRMRGETYDIECECYSSNFLMGHPVINIESRKGSINSESTNKLIKGIETVFKEKFPDIQVIISKTK